MLSPDRGDEVSDDAELEEDGAPSAEPVHAPPSAPDRRLRVFELALVLSVAFLWPVIYSIELWWIGSPLSPSTPLKDMSRILDAAMSIALLTYVLHRQGRSLDRIGLTARLSDIPLTILLGFFSAVFKGSLGQLMAPFFHGRRMTALPSSPGVLRWLAVIPGAAHEELIVRAFLITEVSELTGSDGLAVLASVGLQTLYHTYQGTANALYAAGGFLVASLFYAATRRITPVILVHAMHNFWVIGGGH
jgi:membrane protease YdiL (CAAX protease family)